MARGLWIARRAMLIKSALRDLLSVSYVMISVLRIGSLRSPPPIRLRRTSPRESVSHDSQVALLPYESCSLATPMQGAEQPVLKVESLITELYCPPCRRRYRHIYMMAPKAPYLPSGAVLYTSRGREPSTRPGGVSRSRTEPLAPRAKGRRRHQPSPAKAGVNLREYGKAPPRTSFCAYLL